MQVGEWNKTQWHRHTDGWWVIFRRGHTTAHPCQQSKEPQTTKHEHTQTYTNDCTEAQYSNKEQMSTSLMGKSEHSNDIQRCCCCQHDSHIMHSISCRYIPHHITTRHCIYIYIYINFMASRHQCCCHSCRQPSSSHHHTDTIIISAVIPYSPSLSVNVSWDVLSLDLMVIISAVIPQPSSTIIRHH